MLSFLNILLHPETVVTSLGKESQLGKFVSEVTKYQQGQELQLILTLSLVQFWLLGDPKYSSPHFQRQAMKAQ